MGGVPRSELLSDSARLPEFIDRLLLIRDKSTPTHIVSAEADLIQSPAKVAKRQDSIKKQLGAFDKRVEGKRERTDAKLRALFPELRALLK